MHKQWEKILDPNYTSRQSTHAVNADDIYTQQNTLFTQHNNNGEWDTWLNQRKTQSDTQTR